MPEIKRKMPTPPDGREREAALVPVKSSQEFSNVYELEDGTIFSLKTVVTEIWRVEGVFDEQGNPFYLSRSTNIATVTAPDSLKKRMS